MQDPFNGLCLHHEMFLEHGRGIFVMEVCHTFVERYGYSFLWLAENICIYWVIREGEI